MVTAIPSTADIQAAAERLNANQANFQAHIPALDDPRWREQIKALKLVTTVLDAVVDIERVD